MKKTEGFTLVELMIAVVIVAGLLALPSNIGHFSQNRFAVVPEVGVVDHVRAEQVHAEVAAPVLLLKVCEVDVSSSAHKYHIAVYGDYPKDLCTPSTFSNGLP